MGGVYLRACRAGRALRECVGVVCVCEGKWCGVRGGECGWSVLGVETDGGVNVE